MRSEVFALGSNKMYLALVPEVLGIGIWFYGKVTAEDYYRRESVEPMKNMFEIF